MRKIHKIDNDDSRDRLIEFVDECRKIRQLSFDKEGKLTADLAIKLNIAVKTIIKNLNIDKEIYKQHGEEILEQLVRYSREIHKGLSLIHI